MRVRCKFKLASILQHAGHSQDGNPMKTYTFTPEYDPKIPEDQVFMKNSPAGKFEISVSNPAVHEHYKLGEFYYFDSVPAPTE